MKIVKTAALGILLASAVWIPGFANGFDEAVQVTRDPYVAYTLYEDMPIEEAIHTFDALPDWGKKMEYVQPGPYSNGQSPLCYTYTRTLADKTKQVLTFSKFKNQEVLGSFKITFYTKKVEDAIQMFEQAYRSIDSYQKWTKAGNPNSKQADKFATFWTNDGYTVQLEVNIDKKMFSINRYSVELY